MTDDLGVLEILDHTHIHNEVHKQLALYKLKDPAWEQEPVHIELQRLLPDTRVLSFSSFKNIDKLEIEITKT